MDADLWSSMAIKSAELPEEQLEIFFIVSGDDEQSELASTKTEGLQSSDVFTLHSEFMFRIHCRDYIKGAKFNYSSDGEQSGTLQNMDTVNN